MAKSSNNVASEYPEKYERLREELGRTEWIALGSLIERGEPGQGGPRYQWSRRAGGKTVTVALSAEQFEWMKVAVANQRRVWDLLQEMQQATMEYMLENLPHPPRRKASIPVGSVSHIYTKGATLSLILIGDRLHKWDGFSVRCWVVLRGTGPARAGKLGEG